jgi:hypothetical protein
MQSVAEGFCVFLVLRHCCPYMQAIMDGSAGDNLIADNILHYPHSFHVIISLFTMVLKTSSKINIA